MEGSSSLIMKIIIIGGGISGLSAAYYAQKLVPDGQITLIEASDRWGGKITTQRVPFEAGDFIIEGGPDTFLATKPWGVTLCQELGLSDRLHGTNPHHKNTYVLHHNRLEPLPDGLAMMVPTDIPSILKSRLVSWPGKVRMGFDFLLPAHNGHHDESLGSFVSRRLGREAYENLIEPLMSGIYAGNGDRLSLQSTFPYLQDLESKHGSLARGALQMRKQMAARGSSTQGSRSAFLTPTTGLSEIVEALVTNLTHNGVEMRLNTQVSSIAYQDVAASWQVELENGESLQTDGVILAAPAFASASILSRLDPDLASVLQSIPYTSTATVTLAYRQSDLSRQLDGYGYVIPRREGRRALACTWTSTKFPHRAPSGCSLIRVFVGRAGQESDIRWDKDSLLELAREELELTLGITAEPLVSRVFIWEQAMPQYNLGHPEKLAKIEAALEKYSSLALAGNGYRGIGIPDCIHSGEMAIEKIISAHAQKCADMNLHILENSAHPG
ncbi:MAG: protoporphyrinogen oxidase [Chloroflexi bacterium GWB2_49_20]|nr:MAG: protoporphyrinogen oxidase [Chloroflexi bacterium GWB2_49_20]OGN77967.1 MAG: protoporphyrinogen oxidase [Chloroflexi bacterium GWC2_49_37]OGN85005.1 MAG: protoporphyrinogen oxidase [Chloroflexi bacterium GWD2_49_16]HBG74964.1 protoporphyrinogen oxidase [Anaerolineae bacterium]HCC78312.1 protoporphyrinogen oxidase [Anaerolineae bacterium]